ncbi:MAG: hypothetical protein ACKV2Q_15145 [Planctomycetaceae bacterium]
MSLQELQLSIAGLPRADRESLLRFLGRQLSEEANEAPSAVVVEDRSQWVSELRELRERVATDQPGRPLSQVIDELRAE